MAGQRLYGCTGAIIRGARVTGGHRVFTTLKSLQASNSTTSAISIHPSCCHRPLGDWTTTFSHHFVFFVFNKRKPTKTYFSVWILVLFSALYHDPPHPVATKTVGLDSRYRVKNTFYNIYLYIPLTSTSTRHIQLTIELIRPRHKL